MEQIKHDGKEVTMANVRSKKTLEISHVEAENEDVVITLQFSSVLDQSPGSRDPINRRYGSHPGTELSDRIDDHPLADLNHISEVLGTIQQLPHYFIFHLPNTKYYTIKGPFTHEQSTSIISTLWSYDTRYQNSEPINFQAQPSAAASSHQQHGTVHHNRERYYTSRDGSESD